MAWYVVHVGQMLGIYLTWEDCYAQVNRYPGNLHKKYNTEAEALRAYCTIRPTLQTMGRQPTMVQ